MINFFKNFFLKFKLKKRLKVLKFQSKGEIKSLDSMLILTSNNDFDENIFFSCEIIKNINQKNNSGCD